MNVKVPSTYIIEQTKLYDPLIIDCEYETETNETGFVLKWLLNQRVFAQWIPKINNNNIAYMSYVKDNIDVNYQQQNILNVKHKAVSIIRPAWNLTGDYTCVAQTFESVDRRSAHLQIIVAESDYLLTYNITNNDEVFINCTAKNIYPEPVLKIL